MNNRKISMIKGAVETTAAWILANNKYLVNSSYQGIIDSINDSVQRVKELTEQNWEMNYSSTAGYTVIFFPVDNYHGTIEILVDPCVSKDYELQYI